MQPADIPNLYHILPAELSGAEQGAGGRTKLGIQQGTISRFCCDAGSWYLVLREVFPGQGKAQELEDGEGRWSTALCHQR